MGKRLIAVLALVAVLAPVGGSQRRASAQALPETRPPSVLLIVTDDQSKALFNRELMPAVFSRLVDRGVTFDNAYVNTAQCCPSRAQILTGLYGRHSGVDGNHVPLLHPTIAELLRDEGYRTAMVGKYMNSAPCQPRGEFDLWACIRTDQEHVSLKNPVINIGGQERHYRGYQTEILRKLVGDFIEETPDDQPFFAVYSPTSPHMPADDDRYKSMDVAIERSPSYDEATDLTGKPAFMRRGPLSEDEKARIDLVYTKMARSVRALDDSIGKLLTSLGDRASDTIVVMLSDNGYMYGEHRATKKVLAYEESVKVPMVIRANGVAGAQVGTSFDGLVSNVDIAATLADLVGRQWTSDGVSLLPAVTGQTEVVRESVLLEFCNGLRYPCEGTGTWGSRRFPSFSGVVQDGYKYIEYFTGEAELYDLGLDPYEMTNVFGAPGMGAITDALSDEIESLTTGAALDTMIVSGPPDTFVGTTASFRYSSQNRRSTFVCRTTREGKAGAWFGCPAFGFTLGKLTPGHYVFEVAGRYEDWADPTPAVRSFTVTD
jgi:N-acetylglucosamine-6-sulfatase